MKIRILSDLHLELSPWKPPKVDADMTVLAGDIHSHTHALDWILENIDGPVVYVPGNHEFWDAELHGILTELRRQAPARVHVLNNSGVTIDGVRFLGATLWTDYMLFGNSTVAEAMRLAKNGMPDHERIRCAPENRFTPFQAQALYRESARWLAVELAKPQEGKTVVVTHHLPSMASVSDNNRFNVLAAAFASEADYLVKKANVWIHGHTHKNLDYDLDECRVVCNPRGYMRERYERTEIENKAFNPELVIEL